MVQQKRSDDKEENNEQETHEIHGNCHQILRELIPELQTCDATDFPPFKEPQNPDTVWEGSKRENNLLML